METRRAKPQRIINDRYFQSIAKKQKPVQMENNQNAPKPGPFSLASSSREVTLEPAATQDDTGFDLQLDANTKAASHQVPQSGGSIHGDFQVQPATQNMINNVVQVGPLTTDPQTVAPQTVAPQTVAPQRPGLVDLNPKTPMLDRFKVSLKGKCPVTLMTEGRWVDGDSKFGIVHRNRTYIFASAEKLAIFRSYPDKFSPMLAGYDPVVYHEQGKLVEGLVENGIFMGQMPEQQVVLFQDAATRAKFQASPKTYLETIRQATNSSDQKTMR